MARFSWTLNLYKRLGVDDPKELGEPGAKTEKHRLAPRYAKNLSVGPAPVGSSPEIAVKIRTPPRGWKVTPLPNQGGASAQNGTPSGTVTPRSPGASNPATVTPMVLKVPAPLPHLNRRLATKQHSDQYREMKIMLAEGASSILGKYKDYFKLDTKNRKYPNLQELGTRKKIENAMNHLDLELHENKTDHSINLISALLQAAKGIHSDADLPEVARERNENRVAAHKFDEIEAKGLLQTINGFENFEESFKHFPAQEKAMLAALQPDQIPQGFNWSLPIGAKQFPAAAIAEVEPIPDVRIKLLLQLIGLRYDMNISLNILDVERNGSALSKRPNSDVIADPLNETGSEMSEEQIQKRCTPITLINVAEAGLPTFNLVTKSEKTLAYNPELQPEKRMYWKSYPGRAKAMFADIRNSTRKKARNASIMELEEACKQNSHSQKVLNTYLKEKEKRTNFHSNKNGFHNPFYTFKNILRRKRFIYQTRNDVPAQRAAPFSMYTVQDITSRQTHDYPDMSGYTRRDFERAAIVQTAQTMLLKKPELARPRIIVTTDMANRIDSDFKTAFDRCDELDPTQKNIALYFLRKAFVTYENAIRLGDSDRCFASKAECNKALEALLDTPGASDNKDIKNALKAVRDDMGALASESYEQETVEQLKIRNLERYLQICTSDQDLADSTSNVESFKRAYQYIKQEGVKEAIERYDRLVDDSYTLKPFFPQEGPQGQSRAARLETLIANKDVINEPIEFKDARVENILSGITQKFREGKTGPNGARTINREMNNVQEESNPLKIGKEELKRYTDNELLDAELSEKTELTREIIVLVKSIESLFYKGDEADITVKTIEQAKESLKEELLLANLKEKLDKLLGP